MIEMHFVLAGHSDNPAAAAEHLLQLEVNPVCIHNNGSANRKEEIFHVEESDLPIRYGA